MSDPKLPNDPALESGPASCVLVVDDEPTFRETLLKVLSRRGFQVSGAGTGEEALQLLTRQDFDVMVLDLKMPGMSGLEVLRQMPAVRPSTRVIMLTGHGTVADGIEAMTATAVEFMLKPVVVEELVLAIRAAAASRRMKGT
jgi:two-component system response regulator AtoC